jgi:hypothetical protein
VLKATSGKYRVGSEGSVLSRIVAVGPSGGRLAPYAPTGANRTTSR